MTTLLAGATLPKLSIEHLSKSYRKGNDLIEAVRDVSIDIAPGEFVSIVGASGCGKTTLLRMLDGLIAPTSGSIKLDQQPIDGPGYGRAFVFQQDRLLPWRNVVSNVMLGSEIKGNKRAADRERALKFIELVGLLRKTLSARTLGRHAPTRQPRARPHGRAGSALARRAVRLARCADARDHASRIAARVARNA
jgi:ABC-type multidrug transport system ATPase subunit